MSQELWVSVAGSAISVGMWAWFWVWYIRGWRRIDRNTFSSRQDGDLIGNLKVFIYCDTCKAELREDGSPKEGGK